MFNTILVAVDGSGHADKAVDLAIELAQKHGSKLILLTVYNQQYFPPEVMGAAAAEVLAQDLQAEHDFAEKVSSEAAERARKAGVKAAAALVRKGDAAAQILDTAKAEKADTIVMGSHGHGTLKGLLIGSVSTKVAAHAEVTCITVR